MKIKEKFEVKNNLTKFLKQLLNKSLKTSDEINLIFNTLKNSSLFNNNFINKDNNLNDNDIKEICKHMQIVQFPENHLLIKENDYLNLNLYFILEGKVAIFKKSLMSLNLNSYDKKKYIIDRFNNQFKNKLVNNLFKKNISNIGKFVRVLEKNHLLGENSLLNKIKKRTASVITITKVDLILISKNIFESKLSKIVKQKIKQKENFIQSVFKESWNRDTIDKFFYSTNFKEYKRNNFIIKEGDIPKKIYFIYKGQVKIFKKNQKFEDNKIHFKPNINLETLQFPNCFGEEILYDPFNKIKYNAVVESSYCFVYELNISEIGNILSLIDWIRNSLKGYYDLRTQNRQLKTEKVLKLFYTKKISKDNIIKSKIKKPHNYKKYKKYKNVDLLLILKDVKKSNKNYFSNYKSRLTPKLVIKSQDLKIKNLIKNIKRQVKYTKFESKKKIFEKRYRSLK